LLSTLADEKLALDARTASLQRYRELPSGRERPSRYWRVDLDAISIEDLPLSSLGGSVEVECEDDRVQIGRTPRAFGATSARNSKFGALAAAFANRYALVTIPANTQTAAPITITYRAPAGAALFPYTCVLAERGSAATVIERLETESGAFVCGIAEIVTEENSALRFASVQNAAEDARCIATRAALPGRDSQLSWCMADLGAALTVSQIDVELLAPGSQTHLASIFFPCQTQHVDIRSTLDHRVGDATSRTLVKSAAAGRGQARYVGNIRIAPNAQHSDASLRDDALLLSPTAHVDSVPALEIGANDVRAYHGATVGALDAESLFYMTTRGIERDEAERMVTLGFFETAIAEFPESLHEELRAALARKLA
jgi:Fe-S cluster assembly protein SufD